MDKTRPITWLPGIVFAWALPVAIMGFSKEPINSQAGLFTFATLLALGSMCGFAFDQEIWSSVVFITPFVGVLTYTLVSLDSAFLYAFLFVAFAAAPLFLQWLILRYFRYSRIAWAIIVAASIAFVVWFISFILIGVLIAGGSILPFTVGIPLGTLFRTAYEFRRPTSGLPQGLIHRQFSLRSMFWVTTWFAILFAVLSLEHVSLNAAITGTLAFLIAGTTMYAAVTIHYRYLQSTDPRTVDALPPKRLDSAPPDEA